MNRAVLVILGTAGLLLAACSSPPSDVPPDILVPPTESGTTLTGSGKLRPAANVFYRDYVEGDIGHGKPAVLFFAQTGDVFSQRSDRILKHLYGSGAATISTFRLDSGTASGMALQYTVLLPDTFVVLNGSGSKLSSILHPNPSELQKLVVR